MFHELRSLPAQQSIYDGSDVPPAKAQTKYEYDSYTEVIAPTGAVQHDSNFSTTYYPRGNVTAIQRWLDTNGTWMTMRNQYDDAGNVRKTKDPQGNSATFIYADSWGNAACQPSGGSASAFLTSTTNALGHISSFTFDSCGGKPLSVTDPNGQVTTLIYDDPLDRLTQIIRAYGKPIKNRSLYSYDDTNLIVTTQSDQFGYQDGGLKSETVYDGLGRVSKTRQYETASNYIVVDTTYDAMGRKHTVSNPHRLTPSATDGITTYGYDALSRLITVTAADGSVTNTSYWGNQTTIWDPANKQRRSTADALGRLTQVEEMQEYPSTAIYATTTYSYDALDDLTTVNQGGSGGQYRTFNYDSLKRLTSATNPESGTTLYPLYDGNGNLMTKTEARGVTTHYTYDALNRIQTKSYDIPQGSGVAPTSPVWYCYDTATNGIGRLRAVTLGSGCTGDGSYFDAYDMMGRVTTAHQVTDGQTYGSSSNPSYEYNLAGELIAETYPSGRKISTGYDTAGRINGVTGSGNKTYASSFTYWPHGAMNIMKLGGTTNPLWEHAEFKNRLQPTEIGLGTSDTDSSVLKLAYSYNTPGQSDNNGNMLTQTISVGATSMNQKYEYDAFNRLKKSGENNDLWWYTYEYDQYGNRDGGQRSDSPFLPALLIPGIDHTKNRISDTNYIYDSAGNLTHEPSANGQYSYDAENRMLSASGNSGSGTYSYDGDGRRVMKTGNSATTVFVYNAMGQLVAEYCTGQCTGTGGTKFLTADHLGSTRVVTDSSGMVLSRHDYLPFGETIPAGIDGRTGQGGMGYEDPDGINQKFTSKERDAETGLDYFGARYMSSPQGRFLSPDPLLLSAKLEDPQTWNRYAYARNNPLRYIDPLGLYASPAYNCDENHKQCLNDEQRRILENSKIGKEGLSGEKLYDSMTEKQQNAFVNITDRLASVELSDGSNALSKVQAINVNPETGKLASDRIFASVDSSLATGIEGSDQFTRVGAGDHGTYSAESFKDWNVTFGNVQFSFNKANTGADIDMDIGNITNGLLGGIVHAGEYLENKIFKTTTSQDTIRKLLIHNPKVQTITPSPDPKWNRQ